MQAGSSSALMERRVLQVRRLPKPELQAEQQQQAVDVFWANRRREIEEGLAVKNHILPVARLKKVIRAEEPDMMVAADTPAVLTKACELFVQELTVCSWLRAERHRRRILQDGDISEAVAANESYDFLADILLKHKRERGRYIRKRGRSPTPPPPRYNIPFPLQPPPPLPLPISFPLLQLQVVDAATYEQNHYHNHAQLLLGNNSTCVEQTWNAGIGNYVGERAHDPLELSPVESTNVNVSHGYNNNDNDNDDGNNNNDDDDDDNNNNGGAVHQEAMEEEEEGANFEPMQVGFDDDCSFLEKILADEAKQGGFDLWPY